MTENKGMKKFKKELKILSPFIFSAFIFVMLTFKAFGQGETFQDKLDSDQFIKLSPSQLSLLTATYIHDTLATPQILDPNSAVIKRSCVENSSTLSDSPNLGTIEVNRSTVLDLSSVPSQSNEAICFCDLSSEEIKELEIPLIGHVRSQEFGLRTGNDNFLHGAIRMTDLIKYDGNDLGRTFDLGLKYRLTGTKGELTLGLDSTGYGRNAIEYESISLTRGLIGYFHDGMFVRPVLKMEFMEEDRLSLRYDRFFPDQSSPSQNSSSNGPLLNRTRVFTELALTHQNDHGPLAQNIQAQWHQYFADRGFNVYDYRDFMKSKNSWSAFIGVGRDVSADLGRWRCQLKTEAQVGYDSKKSVGLSASAKAELTASHQKIP